MQGIYKIDYKRAQKIDNTTMKKLLLALLMLPLLTIACSKEETPAQSPEPHELTLTSDSEVSFAAEGGTGTISFTYTPAKEGDSGQEITATRMLSISCDAEWIEIAEEVEIMLSTINYDVAENTTTEPRTAVINATYEELSFSVTIEQAAATSTPEPEPSYEGWGIVGTINNWDVSKAIVMEEANGYYVAKAVELETSDKIKFVKDGDNAVNRGGNGQPADPDYFYTAQSWGSDIHVSQAGTFDIYLNAKEDTYYIMTQGKSPAEALEPLAPGEELYEVYGNFEGEKARLIAEKRYMVAKAIKFSSTTAEFDIRLNKNERVFGAKQDATYSVKEMISTAESDIKIKVEVESGIEYDIYYRADLSCVWLMPQGTKPFIWNEATGVAFSSTNFAINLRGEGLELFFDFYCGVDATNNIIPEATYYVDNEDDGGYNFNLDNEYDMRIEGFKTKLKSGTMVVKHISGGYDITVDVESIHNHVVKVRYTGPIDEIDIMGRPITNPE